MGLSKEVTERILNDSQLEYPIKEHDSKEIRAFKAIEQVAYITGGNTEAERAAKLVESLNQIRDMKLLPGETDYRYAFNRVWHIATDALSQYNNPEIKKP